MKDKPVKLVIEAPEGTNIYVPKNNKESECLLSDKTSYVIREIGFNIEENKWIINVRLVNR